MRRLIPLLLAALLALTLAPAAGAQSAATPQGSGLPSGIPQEPSAPTTDVAPTTTTSTDTGGGLEGWQELVLLGIAIVLIVGIAYAIVHDAHKVAPATEQSRREETEGRRGTRPPPNRAQARKRAKAQKAARRHNR